MNELLRTTPKEISGVYVGEFLKLAKKEVSFKEPLNVREKLIAGIYAALTDD